MTKFNCPAKLTLTILRVKGKAILGKSWVTSKKIHTLGSSCSFPSGETINGAYVDDEHAQIYCEDGCWYIRNLSSQLSLVINGEILPYQAVCPLTHNTLLEFGLCQIIVSDSRHVEANQVLQNILKLNTENTTFVLDSEKGGDLTLNDSYRGQVLGIGVQNATEKTTFEDMGLGISFDEEQFFQKIQSESTHIRNLQITEKIESLDVLDQLAIESEIAMINPSLLNKQVDYWQKSSDQKYSINSEISELEHLFDLKNHRDNHMVPLDNLEYINDLLANKDDIDLMIGRLDGVENYALFEGEQSLEPLRLFSLDNLKIQNYVVQNTPEFTQKEHHISSMDTYFLEPNSKSKPKRYQSNVNKQEISNDAWLNKFRDSLNDQVSGSEILDLLVKKSNHK